MNPESDPMVNASPGKMIRVGAAKGDLAAEAAEASYGHNGTIYSLLSPSPFPPSTNFRPSWRLSSSEKLETDSRCFTEIFKNTRNTVERQCGAAS